MSESNLTKGGMIILAVALITILSNTPCSADDEVVYFSGQTGWLFNADLSNITNVGGSYEPGTTASDLDMKNSSMYGAKLGIYSRRGILGLETEIFRTTPDVKRQRQTFHEPTFGPFVARQGYDVSVTTWAVNLLARVPLSERMALHVGAGPAYFWGRIRDSVDTPRGGAQRSNRLGLNTQVGINYFFTPNVGLSAEWKYNHARFHFPEDPNEHGFRARYNAHLVAASIGYYFDVALPWKLPRAVRLRDILGLPTSWLQPGGRNLPPSD